MSLNNEPDYDVELSEYLDQASKDYRIADNEGSLSRAQYYMLKAIYGLLRALVYGLVERKL